MYVFTTINCGFYHQFNNDAEINQLVELMKKNPDAQYHFELRHLGHKSEFFDFCVGEHDDGEYGYYNYMTFTVNEKELLQWERDEEIPWSAIYSILYSLLVLLNKYPYFEAP